MSTRNRLLRASSLVLVAALACGCALTSKSDPVIFRYFTPNLVPPPATARPNHADRGLGLRLGRVDSAPYIKERIAFHDADHEVGYYDELRWTERPELYLRRALGRALFEEQGLKELIAGTPTLEIHLDSFEEVRAPRHVARLQVTWMLRDELVVKTQKSFTIERPIQSGKTEAVANAIAGAMSDALIEAVEAIVGEVVVELSRAPAPALAAGCPTASP